MINVILAAAALTLLTPNLNSGAEFAKQLAGEYAAQTRGVETFLVNTVSDIRGGPMHQTEVSETVYATENGVPKRKRVRKVLKNQKPASPDELARLSSAEEGPISRFGMSAPYVPAALADYTFATPRSNGDLLMLDFSSTIADAAHGNGTIVFARSSGHIVGVTYKPMVMPKEPGSVVLTSTTIEIAFGPVTADRWDVVKITRTFTGHAGPFGGRGTVTSTYDGYQTHDTAAAAFAALEL